MLLTRAEQRATLYAAGLSAGLPIVKKDIRWRDESVRVGNLTIHYLDWGSPGKRPLLLLHGGMQTAHSWDLVAVFLKRDFHVVAMDLRGHGDSDWAPDGDYTYAAHTQDVEGLLRHLGWDRIVLMGLSLGGLVALDFAAHHPSTLEALIIVDVGPELNPSGVGRIIDFVRGSAELHSIEGFIRRAQAYNPRRRPEQLRYSLTHNLRRLPNGKLTWKYDPRLAQRRLQAGQPSSHLRFEEMWDPLRRLRCPTLVVRGSESDVLSEETAKKMVAVIPNSRFAAVPAAGHTVPQDNPGGFLAAIRSFLEG